MAHAMGVSLPARVTCRARAAPSRRAQAPRSAPLRRAAPVALDAKAPAGLAAAATTLAAAQPALAANEVMDVAIDGRFGILLLLLGPAVGWVRGRKRGGGELGCAAAPCACSDKAGRAVAHRRSARRRASLASEAGAARGINIPTGLHAPV